MRYTLCAAAVLLFCRPAVAQTSADPGHLNQRFQPQPAQPSVGAPLETPIPSHPPVPSTAAAITFTLSSVSFDGNTVLPDSKLQALAAPYVGRKISLADVYELVGKVTAAYRRAGYILSRAVVPAQRISDGHLRLQIVQGYVGKVMIEGDAGGARPYLQAYGERITADKPLTAEVLERELLLAGDLSGMRVRSVLTASPTMPGAADLTLAVTPKKIDAFLGADNRGSRYLGPYEVQAGVFVNDVFGTGGRLGINGVVTPDDGPDVAYGGVTYDQPIGYNGVRLFVSANYAATKPGSTLRALNTQGRALNGSAALSYPFIRSRDFNFLGSVTFAAQEVRSSNDVVQPLYDDHIRSISGQVFMNLLDDWGGYSSLSLSVTQGLPILGATKASDANKSRVGASGDYTRANFEISHQQPLGNRFTVVLSAAGQTSFNETLLASEQFAIGGETYDRAFDPSEATGDSALVGRAEARVNLFRGTHVLSGVQPYGFVEGGKLWQAHALPGEPASTSLYSAGAGVRFTAFDRVNVDLEWAKPLERDVFGTNNENSRFFFSVSTNF